MRPREASGWDVHEPTLRGETKDHYSSLRLLARKGTLEIRLKQSLNDWWVPVANDVNLRRVERHALIGDEVVMLGSDYHRRPGACGQVLGTTVEAFASAGQPSDGEWADVYASLEAAVPASVAELRRTTFAERNYWRRWGRDIGPWDSHEFTRPDWMRPDPETFARVTWGSAPDRWAPMPGAPDSIASLETAGGREMQVLFRSPLTLNHSSWLRVREPADPEGPVARRDPRYPQSWSVREVGSMRVAVAALQPAVGSWFFAWEEQGRSFELHIRGRNGLDERKALDVLRPILG